LGARQRQAHAKTRTESSKFQVPRHVRPFAFRAQRHGAATWGCPYDRAPARLYAAAPRGAGDDAMNFTFTGFLPARARRSTALGSHAGLPLRRHDGAALYSALALPGRGAWRSNTRPLKWAANTTTLEAAPRGGSPDPPRGAAARFGPGDVIDRLHATGIGGPASAQDLSVRPLARGGSGDPPRKVAL
jgi:hypothetical protein